MPYSLFDAFLYALVTVLGMLTGVAIVLIVVQFISGFVDGFKKEKK
jgi:uncharacterized membrane protein YedE/YeeE